MAGSYQTRSLGSNLADLSHPLIDKEYEKDLKDSDSKSLPVKLKNGSSTTELKHSDLEDLSSDNGGQEVKECSSVGELVKAAKMGDVNELNRLLEAGLNPLKKEDAVGQKTLLHYAVVFRSRLVGLKMVELILNCKFITDSYDPDGQRSKLVNSQDSNGETALHIGAKLRRTKIVNALIKAYADVNIKSNDGVEPLELIYTKIPEVILSLFDKSVRFKQEGEKTDFEELEFDFGPIIGYESEDERLHGMKIETKLLATTLKNSPEKNADILMHPLVQMFIDLKWKKIENRILASVFFHIIWYVYYAFFILSLYFIACPYIPEKVLVAGPSTSVNLTGIQENIDCPTDILWKQSFPLALVVIFLAVTFLVKEVLEMNTIPMYRYIMQLENIGQLFLILSSTVTTIPAFESVVQSNTGEYIPIQPWKYRVAAFSAFISWTLVLGQLGKIKSLRLYIAILIKVLESFGYFISTFSALLIAFIFSFCILMPTSTPFSSLWLATPKVISMMAGELSYSEILLDKESLPFPIAAYLLFVLFTMMITIILLNLLVGLTVSDIQKLQKSAEVAEISSQLEEIYLTERWAATIKRLVHPSLTRSWNSLGIWMTARCVFLRRKPLVHGFQVEMKTIYPLAKVKGELKGMLRRLAEANATVDAYDFLTG